MKYVHNLATALKLLGLVGIGMLGVACASSAPEPTGFHNSADLVVSQVGPWGQLQSVAKIDGIYIAGQPDEAALVAAQAAGVNVVFNLRSPEEMAWQEQAAVDSLGLRYVQVPFVVDDNGINAASVAAINAAMAQLQGETVLLHCASGNRAAAWLALHLQDQHNMGQLDALVFATRAGLSKQALINAVETFEP